MDIEQLQVIAHRFKAVQEDVKWGDHLCFTIGGKIFLITAPSEVPIRACFKVSEEDFDELCSLGDDFGQAKYFAKRKWIELRTINALKAKDWLFYLQKSYNSVVATLTNKQRSELGL